MKLYALAALGFALMFAGPAAAQPDSDARELARQHYDRGLEFAHEGKYREALDEFVAAYEKSPHFAVLYNIGQAYISLERPVEAVSALERYLKEAEPELPEDRIQRIEQQIAAQRAETAELAISVDATGAIITVDGQEVGASPLSAPLRLAAGTHLVSVEAPGRPRAVRSVTLGSGQSLELALELPAAPAPELPPAPPPPPPRAERVRSVTRAPSATVREPAPAANQTPWLGYTLAGAGALLGGAALGTYLWNRERYQEWQAEDSELESDRVAGSYDDRQQANNELGASIEHVEKVTLGLTVASGLALAGAATVFVLRPSTPTPEVQVGSSQWQIGASGRW